MTYHIGIIAEDTSDVDVIDALIKKIVPGKPCTTKYFVGKGFGKINGKCLQWSNVLYTKNCQMLILVRDSDKENPQQLRQKLEKALSQSLITKRAVVIPVKMIEAWLLADGEAIRRVFNIKARINPGAHPEWLEDPKHELEEIVFIKSQKQKRYINTAHNKRIALELDLDRVRKCPSFHLLEEFITANIK